MAVGIDGSVGKPMIREGHGIDVYVRRSLRDVFRKIPTFSLEVKVLSLLHKVCLWQFVIVSWLKFFGVLK